MPDIVSGIWKLCGSLFGLFDLQRSTLEYAIGWKGKREQCIECHCPVDEWKDNSTIMDLKEAFGVEFKTVHAPPCSQRIHNFVIS